MLAPFALVLVASACAGSTPPPSEPEPLDPVAEAPQQSAAVSEEQKQAVAAIQAEDFAKAEALLKPLREQEPTNAEVAFYSGVASEGLGKAQDAARHYRRALELNAKLPDAAANLSAMLINEGQYDRALDVIKEGLLNNPDHEVLLNNQAVAFLEKGQAKEAAEVYGLLVKKSPQNEELKVMQAEAWLAAKDRARAQQISKSLLTSDQRAVLASVADLQARLGDFDSCVAALSRAIGLKDASELRVRRGMCLHGLKQEPKARTDFEKATLLDPSNAAAFYYLGRSLAEGGSPTRARAAFKQAQQLDRDGKIGEAARKAAAQLP